MVRVIHTSAGIINGANLLVKEEFGLSDSMIELIVSSAVGAAALFSLASGVISDAIGRKVCRWFIRWEIRRVSQTQHSSIKED